MEYKVIGLMSGTSLDGLDIAYCRFEKKADKWHYDILSAKTVPYDKKWSDTLRNAHGFSGEKLIETDILYGRWLGEQVATFVEALAIQPDLIASHGHTVFHQPDKHFSYQLGHGLAIMRACRLPVVCDFRMLDVLCSGQGAPLVPIGDQFLFPAYDFCLNIGGIANISADINGKRIAFDVCPANMILDFLARKEGFRFDKQGMLARRGQCIDLIFSQLNNFSYYDKHFPKSLGFEWVNKHILPILSHGNASSKDLLHTCTLHIARQINRATRLLINEQNKNEKAHYQMLVTGGGAFNTFLMEQIQEQVGEKINLVAPEDKLIHYKEAMIFAFLGVLRVRRETNCLQSVTGAIEDTCGGIIFDNEIV